MENPARSLADVVRKGFTATFKAAEDGSRRATLTASTATEDRSRDTIAVEGWDLRNFRKNPVILFAHNSWGFPIAKATSVAIEGGALVAEIEFPPEGDYDVADTCYRLVKGGYLKGVSVGFKPKVRAYNEDRAGYDFQEQELLEISIVPVPDNPEGLVDSVKALSTAQAAGIDLAPLRKALDAVTTLKEKPVTTKADDPPKTEPVPASGKTIGKVKAHLTKCHKSVLAAVKCIRAAHAFAKQLKDDDGDESAAIADLITKDDDGEEEASARPHLRKMAKAYEHMRDTARGLSKALVATKADGPDDTADDDDDPDDGYEWPSLDDDSKAVAPPITKAKPGELDTKALAEMASEFASKKLDETVTAAVNRLRGRID